MQKEYYWMTSLVFLGNEQLSSTKGYSKTVILDELLRAGYDIEAIIVKKTTRSTAAGSANLAITQTAKKHLIPLVEVRDKDGLRRVANSMKSDTAILASFGLMIPVDIIDSFKIGIINVHPSILPQYRGATPVEAAILNGDTATGVSLMQLTPHMDTGGIYAKTALELTGQETKLALTEQLARLGASLLTKVLPDILAGKKPVKQGDSKATYTNLLSKKDGLIDTKKPAEILAREIRAYSDWPGSYTHIFNKRGYGYGSLLYR